MFSFMSSGEFDSDEGRRQTGFPCAHWGVDALRELEKVHSSQNRFSIGVQSLAEVEMLKKRCCKHGRAYGQFAHGGNFSATMPFVFSVGATAEDLPFFGHLARCRSM